jgi:heme-degrading monooxygenase HmoA
MYARSTTIQGDPSALDDGMAYVRDEVMPLVQGMDGCIGLSMLADRGTGRCIVTTAWATEEAMRASEEGIRDSRARAAEMFRASRPEVAEWEIAIMHRMHAGHDGACTRVIWGESDPARAADNMDTFRMAMLPRLEELPGFCSVSMMVDRATGRSVLTTTYDSREEMDRSAEKARAMREEFTPKLGVRITDVAEFDLVLHHLRVPETV